MIKTAAQKERMRIAYESNPYKQLVLVGAHNGEEVGDLKGAYHECDELNTQVIEQMRRTNYLAIYGGKNADKTNSEFNTDSVKDWLDGITNVEGIKEWLERVPGVIDGAVRVIAYSAKDATTLEDVYWTDSPLNSAGGIFGFDSTNPELHYELPKKLLPKLDTDADPFMSGLGEDYAMEKVRTVRWTEDITACKVANTIISLSSKFKLLDMNKILIHI